MRYSIFAIISLILLIGCSGSGGNPVAPGEPPEVLLQTGSRTGHMLWGQWEIDIDTLNISATAAAARNADAHYDVTQMIVPPACNNCVAVQVNSFDPVTRIMDMDITLTNPYPVSGYDVRGILFTDAAGHMLRNPDAWTKLYDPPGGGTLNPFIAFAKDDIGHMFAGSSQHTENYRVYIPSPPQYQSIAFAVDASWPGHCAEPYDIDNFVQHDVLYDLPGSQSSIRVLVADWQDDVSKVTIVIPEITGEGFTQMYHINGPYWGLDLFNAAAAPQGDYEARIIAESPNAGNIVLYDYVYITVTNALTPGIAGVQPDGANPGTSIPGFTVYGTGFQGPNAQVKLTHPGSPEIIGENVIVESANTISCNVDIPLQVQPGMYDVEVTNDCGTSGIGNDVFEVFMHAPDNIHDVTPPWLNFSPEDIAYSNGMAFVAAGRNGLHIFSVVNPFKPVWLGKVATSGDAVSVAADINYAYVASSAAGLQIIDVTPPESAHILKTVPTGDTTINVSVVGTYAYVTDESSKLHIIDIDPPADASIIKTVDLSGDAAALAVDGGYAYVLTDYSSNDLQIIDISSPLSAAVVKTITASGKGIAVDNGYAYIIQSAGANNFKVYDVDPPSTAAIVSSTTTGSGYDIAVSGSYCFVAATGSGLVVVNVVTPADPKATNNVLTPYAKAVTIDNDIAYVADSDAGLFVVDVASPSFASVLSEVSTPGYTQCVTIEKNNLYCCIDNGGVLVYNIASPEIPSLIKRITTLAPGGPAAAIAVDAIDDFAYVATDESTIATIFYPWPDDPYQLYSFDMGEDIFDVFCTPGYVYCAADDTGLFVLDVSLPESPFVAKSVTLPGEYYGIYAEGGYAYVADYYEQLRIVDIDPLPSAYLYNSVPTTYESYDVVVDGGYAYVASSTGGLDVIDVDPPGSAFVAKNLDDYDAMDVAKMGNYIFIAAKSDGLWVVNAANPADATTYDIVPTVYSAYGVATVAGYAYVADETGGLRIFKLW